MSEKIPKHFNVFYSWQSDLDKKANNHFIKNCIDVAIKELKKEGYISVIPRLEKDTQGSTGSPRIADTILKKIDASHLFISDITIINFTRRNKSLQKRLTPNPNVLFELGYALNRLGWERIICLNNAAFSQITDMPFDLKQNRISEYNFNGKDKKVEAKAKLVNLLKIAIKAIIDNYDILLEKDNKKNVHQHDIKVFQGLDTIMNDTKFIDTLDYIGNFQRTTDVEYKLLNKFVEYLRAERNQFLLSDLKAKTQDFVGAVNKMRLMLAKNFFSKSEEWYDEETNELIKSTIYSLPNDEQYFENYIDFEKDRDKRIGQNNNSIDEAIEKYRIFRAAIKSNLYI